MALQRVFYLSGVYRSTDLPTEAGPFRTEREARDYARERGIIVVAVTESRREWWRS